MAPALARGAARRRSRPGQPAAAGGVPRRGGTPTPRTRTFAGRARSRRLFRPSRRTSRYGNQSGWRSRKTGSAVWTTIARASLAVPQAHGVAPQRSISPALSRGSQAETRAPPDRQAADERERPRVGELVHALAVGQAEHEDGHVPERAERRPERFDGDVHLAVVDPPRQLDQLHLRRPRQEEVRVDRDAVAAHAHARLVDVAVGLAVRRADDLEDVHPDPVRVPGQLVGERDVDVAVRRVGELAQLGRLCRAHRQTSASSTRRVERRRPVRRGRADPADELGVRREVPEHRAREQALRAERDEQVPLRRPGRTPPRAAARTGCGCRRPAASSRR